MPKIIGVKFRDAGKVYYFDPGENTIRYHDHVIVETARGLEYGTVVLSPTEIAEEKITQPLKSVIRMATAEDDEREAENRKKEKEAYRICKQKIAEHSLDMKLIEAEYTFDNSKVLFYFTADGRIDFRDLVKDLAGIFRTRIELRQIGVRDETKLLGGIGSCGRPLCCHTWLSEFAPVSIKMAKDQNLSLNPAKISGTCGRLMCCLKNEAETYASLNKGLPGKGDYVTTPDGLHGDVQSVNILRQTVKVIVDLENDEKELREFEVKDITFIPKAKRQKMLQEMKHEQPRGGKKEAENREAGRRGENGEGSPVQDKDLEWTPNMDNFDADSYIIKDEGSKPKKQREKKKHPQPKEESAKKEHRAPKAAADSADGGAENGGEAGQAKKTRRQRKQNRGPKPVPEGGAVRTQTEKGPSAEERAAKADGGEEAAKARRRRRRPKKNGQHGASGAEGMPEEMRNKDHYGTGEGE